MFILYCEIEHICNASVKHILSKMFDFLCHPINVLPLIWDSKIVHTHMEGGSKNLLVFIFVKISVIIKIIPKNI